MSLVLTLLGECDEIDNSYTGCDGNLHRQPRCADICIDNDVLISVVGGVSRVVLDLGVQVYSWIDDPCIVCGDSELLN